MKKLENIKYVIVWIVLWLWLIWLTSYAAVTQPWTIWELFEKITIWSTENSNNIITETYRLNGKNILDDSITSYELADNSVDTASIINYNVTEEKIEQNSIDDSEIENNSISSWSLATNSVWVDELAPSSVDSTKIAKDSISNENLINSDNFVVSNLWVYSGATLWVWLLNTWDWYFAWDLYVNWSAKINNKLSSWYNSSSIWDYSVALWSYTQSNWSYSVALWRSTRANWENSVSIWYYNFANWKYSMALWYNTQADWDYSTIIWRSYNDDYYLINDKPNSFAVWYMNSSSDTTPEFFVEDWKVSVNWDFYIWTSRIYNTSSSKSISNPDKDWYNICYEYANVQTTLNQYCKEIGYESASTYSWYAHDASSSEECKYYNWSVWLNYSLNDWVDMVTSVTCVSWVNSLKISSPLLEVSWDIKATSFIYNSDKRLKSDIKELDNSLENITSLNWYTYKWKSTWEKDMWLIAQEVEQVYPDLVKTWEDGFKAVKYGNLVAPIIEAIKELFNKYLDQQARIDSLENRVSNLEKLLK